MRNVETEELREGLGKDFKFKVSQLVIGQSYVNYRME